MNSSDFPFLFEDFGRKNQKKIGP